ncbi:MAG: hypothetical protein M3256_10315 [Actinomycetota bacterium]|nr:hypothetical protein [Actinomycetota bacterium]
MQASKALVAAKDFPSGWKEVAPEGSLADLQPGGLPACQGAAPPSDGLSDKLFVAYKPDGYVGIDLHGAVNEEVAPFYPGAAKLYLDTLLFQLGKCPTYNRVTYVRDGPPLGDQAVRFHTSNISYTADGVMVRVGDILIDVFQNYYGADGTDTVLLDHIAEQGVIHLRGG